MHTYTIKLPPYAVWYLHYIRTDFPTPPMMRVCMLLRDDVVPYTRVTAKGVAEGFAELAGLAKQQMRDRSLDLDGPTRGAIRAAHNAFATAQKDIERSLRPIHLD